MNVLYSIYAPHTYTTCLSSTFWAVLKLVNFRATFQKYRAQQCYCWCSVIKLCGLMDTLHYPKYKADLTLKKLKQEEK